MSLREVGSDTWDESVLRAPGLVLVDVWAPWCIPCKRVTPMIEDLAMRHAGGALTCLRLNADEAPDLVARYGVLSLPTLLLIQGGDEVDRITGVPKRGRLDGRIDALLGTTGP